MRHTACGGDFAPQLTCRSCGEPVSEKDVVAQWGPSGSWARSVPTAATRRRSAADQRNGEAGLFPQTMSVLGNRWAFALLVAAFVGDQPVHRLPDAARRAAGFDRRPAVDLRSQRGAGRCGQPLSTHREGPRPLPGADIGAAVGPAVVPRARRTGGRAHAHSVRSTLHGGHDLRPVHPAAARNDTSPPALALSGTQRVLISQVHSDLVCPPGWRALSRHRR